ncbi:DEAD/DEAH box helicase family protein [Actinacidiphila bryophytorum]|uniref:Guanylate kinase n=1 Tax=Actinacidiphila bryophytorum TaxID=1436133 RepID=A0A9W4MHE2_9ACTN|nr:guanylate kinase [Actinacidiphila bryophytorum]MBM9435166.1 guanylate kinase [Actinacidiphila bryophytorum]MBN6541547.1 guanylate kinase [Actinacidiphila bryophytorum]CAG7643519.1 Guanylate kinase [Actinacidiphila bryophytorum]
MRSGILLYGPPAAGKDTVTTALAALDARYVPFRRLKVGSGKSAGYRMGTAAQLADLEVSGDVIYRNERYGNVYVVDRPGLDKAFESGMVPVVHLGQVAGVEQVAALSGVRWVCVLLWCSRTSTAERSRRRGDTDTTARLAAWDATREDLASYPQAGWEVQVDTGAVTPQEAAQQIDAFVRSAAPQP